MSLIGKIHLFDRLDEDPGLPGAETRAVDGDILHLLTQGLDLQPLLLTLAAVLC